MRLYGWIVLFAAFLGLVFGFFLPWLFSAADDSLVGIGFFVAAIIPIIWYFIARQIYREAFVVPFLKPKDQAK